MQVALILPVDCLELAAEFNTKYHLVLPQLLPDDSYRGFYQTIEGFKIMDNGAAEGVEMYHMDLHDAARVIQADEVVAPDVLGDCDKTIEAVRRFERWAQPDKYNYAGVVQGQNMAEVVKCLTFYQHTPWITNVHLPRILNRVIHRNFRFTFLDSLFGLAGSDYSYRFGRIHCLGASEWTREASALSTVPIVRGMDTSLLASMAIVGKNIITEDYVQRQPDFFNQKIHRQSMRWRILRDNIRTYLNWAADPETSGGTL